MSIALSGFVRSVSQLLVPVLILISASGLMAQQYCFSGAVTSAPSCNSCSFQVGDPVAMGLRRAGRHRFVSGQYFLHRGPNTQPKRRDGLLDQ
jgi:hypothetical protein